MRKQVFVAILAIVFLGCRKSAFEKAHIKALHEGPPDVTLELEPLEDRTTLHVGEMFRFRERYSAKYPNQWHIEVLDGWNKAVTSDTAVLNDGNKTWEVRYNGGTIVCCDSRHVWLYDQPLILPMYNDHRSGIVGRRLRLPEATGTIHVYLRTYRVYSSAFVTYTPTGIGHVLASDNIVDIKVIPRDPEWEYSRLKWALSAIDSRSKEAWIACDAFQHDLRNTQATDEKLKRIARKQICASPSSLLVADEIEKTIHGLKQIILDPTHPYDSAEVRALVLMTIRAEHHLSAAEMEELMNSSSRFKELITDMNETYPRVKAELFPSCAAKITKKECEEGLSP